MHQLPLLALTLIVSCYSQVATVQYVAYSDNGFQLGGYLALPPALSGSFPAVIVLPDADGVNQYEVKRIRMLASAGYVAFAADIYGADKRVTNATERSELLLKYRGNQTLYVQRIQAAVNVVRARSDVVTSKIGLMGYCFGGTGVLNYAISGADVSVVVSFHGAIGASSLRLTASNMTRIPAKILIYSGGSDDQTTDIKILESELNAANATWEIIRFSKVLHAFTIWSDSRYNARADGRSWEGALAYLTEVFFPENPSAQPTRPLPGGVPPTPVYTPYHAENGTQLAGYLVEPEGNATNLPAVVVLPGWTNVNDYQIQRARLVASLASPYVGFAADVYGADLHNISVISDRIALATLYRNNVPLFTSRIRSAVNLTKSHPRVDPSRVVVIGYCFGGTGVLNYAIAGAPDNLQGASDVLGVVSFHGGLTARAKVNGTRVPASVLLHSGGQDDAASNIELLEMELNAGNSTWEINRYSGVVHSFTEWDTYAPPMAIYSPHADLRSWRSMVTYLNVLFNGGVYMGSTEPSTIPLPDPTSTNGTSTTGTSTTGTSTTGTSTTGTPKPTTSTSSAVAASFVFSFLFSLLLLLLV